MLGIQFSTITNGYRATLVFSNLSALGNGYDSYDITLAFDPSKASLVLPAPDSASTQYGLAAKFAGTAFVNVSQLSQGKLVIGGISLSPLSTSTPLGSLDFTSVASSGFSVTLEDPRIGLGASDVYSTLTDVVYPSPGSVTTGGGTTTPTPVTPPTTSPDTAAPLLVSTDPVNSATVSPNKPFISLNFNEAIVAGAGSIELRAGTTLVESFNVATSGRVSILGSILTIDPTASLSGSTSYSLSVPAGAVRDAAGNAIGSSITVGFATSAAGSDTTAPSLNLASPANTATGVATTANIELTFSESVQLGVGEIRLLTSSGSLVESFTTGSRRITVNGDTVVIDPSNEFATSTSYRLDFTGNAVEDLVGNSYAASSYSFQTASLPAASLSVSADKTSVNEGQTVVFTVSAPSLNTGTSIAYRLEGISLKDLDSGSLSGQITLNAGKTAQLSVLLKADNLLEGPETLTFTSEGVSVSTTVVDTSAGSSLAQEIQAGSQGGTIMLSAGPDRVTGSSERDIAFINGSSEDYSIQIQGDKAFIQQASSLNIDTLVNVERVQFSDKSVALDIEGVPGQAYRIYKAAFGREPDLEGVGFWISRMEEQDWDLIEVSARFIDSNEFRASYGTNPSDAQYLTKLYENVLGRVPDLGGYNWWLNELETNPNKTRAKVLADFAEGAENQSVTAELVVQGISYDPWVLG